jgi:hypothetical protein
MKLIDEALQSHYCVISVMGAHANEGSKTIFGRKMQDIDKTGTTYWLMRSPKARPPEVQDICNTTTSYVIFIEPASKGGARPTTTEDAASQFSPDRRSWKALPPGIGPVTGKLDTAATALVFDRLETVQSGKIDLWAYAEAVDSRTPLPARRGILLPTSTSPTPLPPPSATESSLSAGNPSMAAARV